MPPKWAIKWPKAWPADQGWPTISTPLSSYAGRTVSAFDIQLRRHLGSSWCEIVERLGGPPNRLDKPLSEELILSWADEFFRLHKRWPTVHSKMPVPGMDAENWRAIDSALRKGCRGLRKDQSLVRLLAEHRGVRKPDSLTETLILVWADEYFTVYGKWPTGSSHEFPSPCEKWKLIDSALRLGHRGLPGGSCLAKLLFQKRSVESRYYKKPKIIPSKTVQTRLTKSMILGWADAYYKEHGWWPCRNDGEIVGTNECWRLIDNALMRGSRGLTAGSSLSRLLFAERGASAGKFPVLTEAVILSWADKHFQKYGHYPYCTSKERPAPGQRWDSIDVALRKGYRGLCAGSSLPLLLHKHRGVSIFDRKFRRHHKKAAA